MKKLYTFFGIAVMAFSILSCQKEIVNNGDSNLTEKKNNFELFASIPETKTVTDGFNVKWSEQDQFNVFHHTTNGYIDDGAFTIDDAESGHAAGTLKEALDAEGAYDWYAMYPYSSYCKTPENVNGAYYYMGRRSDQAQVQEGNNSTAHLADQPMWGQAKNVLGSETLSITMNQIVSVIEVNVTNSTDEQLSVNTVSFTGTEDIVGAYYINFAGNMPVFSKYNDYQSSVANLTVENGEPINIGSSAKYYIAIKPFTAESGSRIKVSVNGHEKTIPLSKATTFSSGKVKKINFNYDYVEEEADFSGEWLITGVNSGNTYAMGAYVSPDNNIKAISESLSFTSEDKVKETDAIAAGKVTIAKVTTEGDYKGMYTIKDASGNYLYAAGTSSQNYLKTTATLNAASYWTITLNGDEYSIIASRSEGRNVMRFNYNGGSPLFSCYASGQSPVSLFSYENIIPDTTPAIMGITDPATVSKDGATVTVNYSIKNPVSGKTISASSSETWVNTFDYSVAGAISFTVDANTGAARNCTVTVSYEGANDVTFNVAQQSGTAGTVTYTMSIDSSDNGKNNVHWTGSSISSLTYDDITWNTSVTGTTSFTSSTTYCQIGSKNNPATNVTLSTSGFAGKTITSVKVTCYCMSNTGPTLTVKAGATTMINGADLTKTTSTEMVSGSGVSATLGNSDNLTIEFNSSAKAAICISNIEVTYNN